MKSPPPTHRSFCGGVWWCLACNAPADLEDPGDPYPRCVVCGQRKCQWRGIEDQALKPELSAPAAEPAPEHARPMLNVRRLPREKRPTLTQMTYAGYWLCRGCDQPTEKDAGDCCVLCGSGQVEFQEPTL